MLGPLFGAHPSRCFSPGDRALSRALPRRALPGKLRAALSEAAALSFPVTLFPPFLGECNRKGRERQSPSLFSEALALFPDRSPFAISGGRAAQERPGDAVSPVFGRRVLCRRRGKGHRLLFRPLICFKEDHSFTCCQEISWRRWKKRKRKRGRRFSPSSRITRGNIRGRMPPSKEGTGSPMPPESTTREKW
ncbi:hypothetical protein HMPREF1986_00381 [Oribacterium sp. oral taxon 078 str. F0263]|nr:hypothetical protein HMPREF1986_00381 [Oribacterium sp. oral taxon 078 str. F0263]